VIRAILIAAAIYYGLLATVTEPSPYRVWSEGDIFYRLDIETGDVCMTALETGVWICSDDFRALSDLLDSEESEEIAECDPDIDNYCI
jgi:hypothetical protein